MPINRYFKLYLNAGRAIPLVINVNQYDSGETWYFRLFKETGEAYLPSSGAIIGIKADGHVIDNAATVDGFGYVVVTETEQMTAAPGKAVFELSIDDNTHGTANFVLLVEPKPSEGGVLSDSDLSLLQQAIDSTSPAAIAEGVSDWMDEHLTPTTPVVDNTLTVQGAAADAKKTGDEIADLKSAIQQTGGGISTAVREAIVTLLNSALYKVTGLTDEKAVITAWASTVTAITLNQSAISISGEGTYQLVATTTPSGGAVTWASSNTAVATVSSNGLVTSVGNGTATITASSGDVSATCTATITGFVTLTSISAVYTQGGTVYPTDTLDSLKSDLVVTAHYDDSSTATLADNAYTLSGTLTVGTSTVTVSYGGKTATFDVVVATRQMQISSMVTGVMTWAANTGLRYAHATPSRMVMNPCAFPMVKGRTYTLSLGSQWGTYLAGIRVVAGNTTGLDFSIDSSVDKNWTALNESILDDGNQSSDYVYVATEDDSVFTVSIKKPDTTNMTSADLAAVLSEITLVES